MLQKHNLIISQTKQGDDNVTSLPGVTIGDGSVIGADSVVTTGIPSGVVAVGNPCRVLRKITEQDKLSALQNYE